MGVSALGVERPLVWAGAGLFVLSDMILAVRMFRMAADHRLHLAAGRAVWVSYVAGQALIVAGLLG